MPNIKRGEMKKINFYFNEKKFSVYVEECNLFQKIKGLMFSRRETAKILLFEFRKKRNIIIHSFFVFFPFVAIWLNEKNDVIDLKIVKPFTPCVSPSEKTPSLVEIPFNKKNKKILKNLFVKPLVGD